ncbi:hypothetical protein GLOTRDRAFT_111695 [Gloeophyllum trabeum ATCC 11539]|uniref:Uncharacterized protein n=1 Tax=Gloeophyllum trabeum (strain ATCC 11539 / FP-39264 / Madison 617) TaxID=670483 RepID=S7RH38_GLOTA|nr:uncharacterized protein GLOTRDRAFT_111695 [Gloeophyllum trabeum ATCC 11539]EPQ53540.1 hypothetical protein GLOTRDRAFT_111695 [Gloeophyllum trabeum ATCC 11539]
MFQLVALLACLAAAAAAATSYTCSNGAPATHLSTFVVPGSETPGHIWSCPGAAAPLKALIKLEAREAGANETQAVDITRAPCTTYCDTPAGGGPDPNDCSTLANADAVGGNFTIPASSYLAWTWKSCQVTQSNLLNPARELNYTYDGRDWAGVVNYVAWNCQSQENAHGGSCRFYDNTNVSIIQVQTTPANETNGP